VRIVIIGNGVAGIEAALEVRRVEPGWSITIVSEESDHFFSRTALMWVCCGQMSARDIEPYERDLYQRAGFERIRARATGVDTVKREVQLAGGQDPLAYDRLLIACGSRPIESPWPGADLCGVGHFVTLQDLQWLEQELHGGAAHDRPPRPDAHLRATTPGSPYRPRETAAARRGRVCRAPSVIGGGLIGIELVEVLLAAGHRPKFFIREQSYWPMAIEPRESRWVCERMREHGIDVLLGHSIEAIEGDDSGTVAGIRSDRGGYETDLVAVAIGVRPATDWLAQSAIDRDQRGGIIVESTLETSAPDVLAAGDCASVMWFNGARRPEPLWYTAREQGRVAGRALVGEDARYERGTWYNSAKLVDIEYTTVGLVNMNLEGERNWFYEEQGEVRSTTRIVTVADRVVGFNFLGRRWDHSILARWIEQRRLLGWVLKRLDQARFDSEFVRPLVIPDAARRQPLEGPAPSMIPEPIPYLGTRPSHGTPGRGEARG
jgi:NADPH-dependent 2,4-dienoyl-CoA reductase/sulfur reductase-like enzyme